MALQVDNESSNPTTPASGISEFFVLSTDNLVKLIDSVGTVTLLNNHSISSTVASSGSIANTDTKISSGLLCSLNTITAGSLVKFTILGTCTSTAAGSQVFTIRYGSANTVADTSIATATFVAQTSGTTVAFSLSIYLTIRTIGSSGTVYGTASLVNQGTTGIYTLATGNAVLAGALAINTTATGYIGLSYISGNASTACTFQNVITELIRQ